MTFFVSNETPNGKMLDITDETVADHLQQHWLTTGLT